jgi:hypothetical protein
MKRSLHSEATGTGVKSYFAKPEKPPLLKKYRGKKKKELSNEDKKKGEKALLYILAGIVTMVILFLYAVSR